MDWVRTINIGNGDRVVTQGLLRSDGKWWMWEVSDHREYLEETKKDLETIRLDPSCQLLNDGGKEEFVRFFEQERVRRGLMYMNESDVFQV